MRQALLLILLAVPAAAQDADLMAAAQRFAECTEGLDLEAIGERAGAYFTPDVADRLAALCAAGDRDGAAALADETEAAFVADDPEGARMMACTDETYGALYGRTHPCDE